MISDSDTMFDDNFQINAFDDLQFQPPVELNQSQRCNNPENKTRGRSVCETCNRTFSRHSDLERHAKKHQPGLVLFHCSVDNCEYKGSYRKDKLQAHVKRCHSSGEAA